MHVELQEPLEGTQVTPAIVAIWLNAGLEHIALDPRSPASTLLEPLQTEAMPLRLAGGQAIDRYASADMASLLAAELAVWALGDPETADGIEPGAWVI